MKILTKKMLREYCEGKEYNTQELKTTEEKLDSERKKVDVNPTDGQKKAGNYTMGHINILGFNITIENPKGSYRKGKDSNGKEWKTYMHNDYGYFTKTKGKDGDAIDVFIGPNLQSTKIYGVDQNVSGKFDETKVMLGFNNAEQAKKAYLSNYEKDWKGFNKITGVDIKTFKKWLYDGKRQRKPFYQYIEFENKKTLDENKGFKVFNDKKSFEKSLIEAAMPQFSLEELKNIKSFKRRYEYCLKYLGNPVGRGSSRVVFQLDDEWVLKLALNNKGIAQNEAEGVPDYYKDTFDIFARVKDRDIDYEWIISEYVLPAKKQDFNQCLGMSFEDYVNCVELIIYSRTGRSRGWKRFSNEEINNFYDELEEDSMLEQLGNFLGDYPHYAMLGDLSRLSTYGLTLRNGEPFIVILDSGLTEDVFNQYYRQK